MHKPPTPQVPLTLARKAARPLFALLAPATFAACASGVGAAQTSFPLCDGAGAPACGNIGQAGRQGTPAPTDGSRSTLMQATPRVAQGFPMFEVATTTLAAVGLAATTLSVLMVSEWGDAPEHEPTAPTPPVAIAVVPPAPVRQLVEVASVRVLPANDEEVDKLDAQEDKCKDDQANRPVVDGDYRPACGNVMTKGGHKRGRR